FIVRPQARRTLLLKQFPEIRMIVDDGFATDDSRGVSCSREIEDLSRRALGVARNAGGAGFQHAEVSHAPLGRVAAYQHDAIAGFDAFAREKSRDACREFTQISVGVLFLVPVTLDAHCDSRRVSLRRSFE